MITLDDILAELPQLLKKEGYKKQRLNWFRREQDVTLLFTIQRSQWSKETWYYCFGTAINDLHPEGVRSAHYGDVMARLDCVIAGKMPVAEDIARILKMWEFKFGTVEKLRELAIRGSLPFWTTVDAKNYLITEPYHEEIDPYFWEKWLGEQSRLQ